MKEFRFALKSTFPIFITYVFLGIAFGILMNNAGYGILISTASSIFIFAGSMQFIIMQNAENVVVQNLFLIWTVVINVTIAVMQIICIKDKLSL